MACARATCSAGVEYLRSRAGIDAKRISLIGQGSAGLPVLHVAALDQTVRGVAITGTLATYSDVLDHDQAEEKKFLAVLRPAGRGSRRGWIPAVCAWWWQN